MFFRVKSKIALLYLFINVVITVFSVAFCLQIPFNVFYIKSEIFIALKIIISAISVLSVVLTVIASEEGAKTLRKISFFISILIFFVTCGLYTLLKTGLYEKIDSIADLRSFVFSFGVFAEISYIIIQFLQVAILPIPSFITIGAGVLLFGPLKTALLSVLGIISGSLFAFYLGRKLGRNFVVWLIGESNLNKALSLLQGKTRIVLTFTFLLPFFPDDILCFAAGITTVGARFFAVMISCVRVITIFTACYSLNNSLIPFNTRLGVILWIIIFVIAIIVAVILSKKGDKIENKLCRFFNRRKEDN